MVRFWLVYQWVYWGGVRVAPPPWLWRWRVALWRRLRRRHSATGKAKVAWLGYATATAPPAQPPPPRYALAFFACFFYIQFFCYNFFLYPRFLYIYISFFFVLFVAFF